MKDWKIELKLKFEDLDCGNIDSKNLWIKWKKDFLSFIETLLSEAKEEAKQEILKALPPKKRYVTQAQCSKLNARAHNEWKGINGMGYNRALDDIINIIKNL